MKRPPGEYILQVKFMADILYIRSRILHTSNQNLIFETNFIMWTIIVIRKSLRDFL